MTFQEQDPVVQLSADELARIVKEALHQLSVDGIEPLYFEVIGKPVMRKICLPLAADVQEMQEKASSDGIG